MNKQTNNKIFTTDRNLTTFIQALEDVKKEYVVFKSPIELGHKMHRHVERVFSYELYRQWENKLEKTALKLNCEISKNGNYFFSGIQQNSNNCENTDNIGYVYPDLVLHGNQDSKSPHKIVCEIKRDVYQTRDAIKKDLIKLLRFTDEQISGKKAYMWGIMLVYGCRDKDKTLLYYKDICNEIRGDIGENKKVYIVLAHYDKNDSHVGCHITNENIYTLYEIINQ